MKQPIIKKQKHRQFFGVVNNESDDNFINPPVFLEDDYFWLRDDNRMNKEHSKLFRFSSTHKRRSIQNFRILTMYYVEH